MCDVCAVQVSMQTFFIKVLYMAQFHTSQSKIKGFIKHHIYRYTLEKKIIKIAFTNQSKNASVSNTWQWLVMYFKMAYCTKHVIFVLEMDRYTY